MIQLKTPRGLPVDVPEHIGEDPSPRFTPQQHAAFRAYYQEHGYVIISSLLSPSICERQRQLWERQVKPYRGFIYRQATAKAERHVLNANGWVMNPILNLQSVDPHEFEEFRSHSTEHVLTDSALRGVFRTLVGDTPKIVQSMYFEGNSATWEHQDTYYLDSENIGEMAAAWIAIEDIGARAGRFFVCPGSHKIRMEAHGLTNNVVEHHEEYIGSVVRKIRELHLPIRAPALRQGDVLLWNSLTIHGSLDSQDPLHSRSSVTCHAIPASRRLLSLQSRLRDVPTDEVNGVRVFRPKDLSIAKNRLVLQVETRFPKTFHWAKRNAIKQILRRKEEQPLVANL